MAFYINIERFTEWLKNQGCEILPTTNQYELIRFKGKEVGVIYTTGKVNSDYAYDAYVAHIENKKWNGKPINVGRNAGYKKEKAKLIERDGTCCFFCGKELGDDITVEHLIALSCGGLNNLSNMVLSHSECNKQVGNLPISEKVKIALNNRINKINLSNV